ncbi:hypothetical protein MF672_003025 [Actinomadura sp. ATCC 31491]|uniref:Uncharacterized protein n=1 Tax=Actinomadura luzonensis TaxID=2805427 RepID=A0ABT0FLF7_9ACTN|nr:hypothetical protein [Actinomadura luzonensis]MCK2212773.1 hypothetical protein [Actinomadura luzonensis]
MTGDHRPDPRLTASADIVFAATVRAERICFDRAPPVTVTFSGEPGEESASGSRRAGLPDRVAERRVYREVRVDYVIAARLAGHGPDAEERPG